MASEREKIINLPGAITALICVFAALQCVVQYAPETVAETIYRAFAFIPARLTLLIDPQSLLPSHTTFDSDPQETLEQLSGALGVSRFSFMTLLTYAFLHGSWMHFSINALTLAAFGAPVARRLGDTPFLVFLACGAVAGAVTHYALHPHDLAPMVGASAGISAAMAAIVRFAFAPGAILGGSRPEQGGLHQPTESLATLAGNRSALIFLLVWLGTNTLMGAFPQAFGSGDAVAWEAHIGGFVFGLLSYAWFEQWARRM